MVLNVSYDDRALRGFVLLEVALAILIVGVLGTLGISGYRAVCEHRAYSVTEQRMERALAALAQYVKRTGCLPCPASIDSQGESVGQGAMGCPTSVGTLPYAVLGMSVREAQDGWQRPLTYAMDPALHPSTLDVQTHESMLGPFCEVQPDALSIAGTSVSVSMSHPAVVLVSHGPTGPTTQIPDKAQNAGVNGVFVDQSDDRGFDDIVRFVSRDNLLAFYAQTSCPAVSKTGP